MIRDYLEKMRFSVLIATHNREEYLRQAIDSVLAQSFPDYELIVIDDGSDDGTSDILRSYEKNIKTVKQINQGPEAAHRAGALLATGKYLAFLDDDDLFLPWTLATYDKIINSLDSPPVVLGSMFYFKQEEATAANVTMSNAIEVLEFPNYFSKDITIGPSSSRIVVLKSLFDKLADEGKICSKKTFSLNDVNMMLQVGMYGPCVIVVHPVTVLYRLHSTNVINNVEKIGNGLLSLIHDIKQERSSESWSCHFAKEAYLGGLVFSWIRRALRNRQRWLAFRILLSGWSMVIAAGLKNLEFLFYPRTRVTRI